MKEIAKPKREIDLQTGFAVQSECRMGRMVIAAGMQRPAPSVTLLLNSDDGQSP